MAYGLTIDQVRKTNRPVPVTTTWGSVASLTEMPEYEMYRLEIQPAGAQRLHFFANGFQAFVESGELVVRSLDTTGKPQAGTVFAGETFALPRFHVHGFFSGPGAVVYLFGERTVDGLQERLVESGEAAADAVDALNADTLPHIGRVTMDVRQKYWGRIETIYSGDIAAKRIFVQKGGQGSLEFHLEKRETYYVHSGLVRLGLRIGRAENRSLVLSPGESYDMRPGVMHLRIGLEDTVIIELSTRDSDSDSYLVEDGQTYRHIDIDSKPELTNKKGHPA